MRRLLVLSAALVFAAPAAAKPAPVLHLQVPQNNDRVQAIAVSPDGSRLAALDEKHVRIFDLTTGEVVRTLRWGPSEMLSSVAFAPGGKTLFVGGWDTKGKEDADVHLREVEVATGTVVAELPPLPQARPAASLAVSPDGKRLLSSNGSFCAAYDLETHTLAWKLPEPQTGAVAFSPDGKVAVCGGGFKGLSRHFQVVDPAAGTVVQKVSIAGERINSLSFSPDGTLLALGANGVKQIEVFETATWTVGKTFEAKGGATRTAFSPDGKTLVSTGKDAVVDFYDVAKGTVIATSQNPKHFGAFTPSAFALGWAGSRVLKAGWGGVDVLDRKGQTKVSLLTFSNKDGSDDWVSVTPEGTYAASPNAEKNWVQWWTADGSLADKKLWPKDKKSAASVKSALKP